MSCRHEKSKDLFDGFFNREVKPILNLKLNGPFHFHDLHRGQDKNELSMAHL